MLLRLRLLEPESGREEEEADEGADGETLAE